jgi:outer membrane cobalamin receptor
MRPRALLPAVLLSPLVLVSLPPARSSAQTAATPGPPAEAQADNQDPAAPPVFYETTTVTARPVSSATGAVTVLDAREISAQASRSATEIVRDVPGMNLLSSGARAGVTNAYVRGSDPNFTLVLLDGIPLNDATELQGGAVNLEELPA